MNELVVLINDKYSLNTWSILYRRSIVLDIFVLPLLFRSIGWTVIAVANEHLPPTTTVQENKYNRTRKY